MKKHSILRIFAALLVFSLCVSMLPASVFAVSGDEAPETHAATLEDFLAGSATAEDVCGVLDPSSVPEIIGYQEAAAKNHVARLYADEGTDLNKIVFLNVDGSKTMYTYDFPVKYVDEDGSIQDIRLEIADSAGESGGFETAANAAVTTFSARFSDGISLEGNHAEIQLIPVLPSASSGTGAMRANAAADATAQRIDENRIEYRYDAQTTVEYSLTYTGFKEDIVVSEYTGQTVYPFRLYTNGLGLAEIDGSFYLVNDDGSIAATIGDIIIFTADERNNTLGEIVPVTVVEKEEYLLNIVVDADYLADPDTLYPIRIDPTVEICYDNNGDGGIADVTLNSTNGSSGSSGSIYVGLRETYGISRTLMKFPGLNLGSLGNNITVTNASVEIRDLMCESTPLEVSCYVFSGSTWSESTANWSNVSPNSISTFLSSNVISYSNGTQQAVSHRYVFDITAAVEGWRIENYNPEKGIIFKASSSAESGTTYNYKTFASYNRASNKPSLSVTYAENQSQLIPNGTYYLNNRGTGKYLQKTSSGTPAGVSGLLSSLGNTIKWDIQKVSNGYVIRSFSDPTKYLAVPASTSDTSVSFITISDSIIPPRCFWSISLANGGGCLIKSVYSSRYLFSSGTNLFTSSTTGIVDSPAYASRVWRIVSTSNYGNTSSYSFRELSANTTISNIEIATESRTSARVNRYYSNELWAESTDFTYSFSHSGVASYSSEQIVAGKTPGGVKVTATHKVTNKSKTFYVLVGFSTVISSTPLAENIVAGLNQPYDVWPASEESRYYSYTSLNRAEALTNIYERTLLTIAGGALVAYNNAASMLTHFLENTGTRYDINMKQMISEWDTAQGHRQRDINYVIQAVEASATYTNQTLRTITALGCPVNEGTDWGNAVGSYSTSITCTYKKTSSNTFTMQIIYELHDAYDWDRTNTSMGNLPVSQADMWELHHGGVAKNYEVHGINTFTLTWTQGQTFEEGAVMSNET